MNYMIILYAELIILTNKKRSFLLFVYCNISELGDINCILFYNK